MNLTDILIGVDKIHFHVYNSTSALSKKKIVLVLVVIFINFFIEG